MVETRLIASSEISGSTGSGAGSAGGIVVKEGTVEGAEGIGLSLAIPSIDGDDSAGSVSSSGSGETCKGEGVGTLSLSTVSENGLGGSEIVRTDGGNGISSGNSSETKEGDSGRGWSISISGLGIPRIL